MRVRVEARSAARRGGAMVMASVSLLALFSMSFLVLKTSVGRTQEQAALFARDQAIEVADAGVAHVVSDLMGGGSGDVSNPQSPQRFGAGEYWTSINDNGDGTFTIHSQATVGGADQAVEAIVRREEEGVFANAVFAGNKSGDASYEMEMSGSGGQADTVVGDVYSGGDFRRSEDSTVSGTVRSQGDIHGTSGETNVSQSIPDLVAMNYAATAEYDVADRFQSANWQYDSAGGYAYQLPESDPAHIFRKNPTDRWSETSSTSKDDYFLEDPYESVRADYAEDGSDAYRVSLSGSDGEPGENPNGKVFYIDGNLWIHNRRSLSLRFEHGLSDGMQITFVVSGNVYFSDNLFYENAAKDGVVFIAMEDATEPDSGNIYFGDPQFGTLRRMNGFMYAENDFHDINLNSGSSPVVTVNGNMSAGNQVVIDRDYYGTHTKLEVNFDDRISSGALEMPGLPGSSAGGVQYTVLAWRRVAVQ